VSRTFQGASRAAVALAAAIFLAGSAGPAGAQQVTPQTNPGAIGNQNRRNLQTLPGLQEIPKTTGPTVTSPGQPSRPRVSAGGETFVLRKVIISRSALLPQSEIEAQAAPYIGRRIDLSKLYVIVDAINALYEKKGMPNASAILPPQHIDDGVVHVKLVEGRLGKVGITDNKYIPQDFVTSRIPLVPDKVLNVPVLSHQIAVFNRVNDMQVRATLQPGARFGQTDLSYSLVEPPQDTLDFIGDNWGLTSTGVWEGSALYRHRSLVTPDDAVTLYGLGNTGNLSGNAIYDVPVDDFGGRFGVSYGYKSLDITGHSQFGSLQFGQPVYADENWLLAGLANASIISTVSNQGDFVQTKDLTKKGGPGARISYLDAQTLADLTFSYAYGEARYDLLDSSSTFNMLSGTYRVRRALPEGFWATAAGAWQKVWASELPPDQLMSIGGVSSVRGYDSNLIAGFSGAYGQFELHKDASAVLKGFEVYAFLDSGTVSSPNTERETLVGAGIGASYAYSHWTNIQVDAGWPLRTVVPDQSKFTVNVRLIVHAL
jgi:hemolysin activation/secretion protein